ncbi:Grap2 and cyclin-D-interacting-domain-containing protein [Lenzites betulinus]|nr:Grap2 and cyclin-D-interacting-domain-containing protein [Lenzites betulinus]
MSESQLLDLEKGMFTCSAAIDALRRPLSSTPPAQLSERPSCPVLQKDYQSLLTLVYTSTTKLTLVLRPSAPYPKAALAPIADLGTSITSLTACATLFDAHGETLSSYARQAALDICEAVSSLAETFVDEGGKEYLVRTGTVHDLIEKARRELPVDTLDAVKRRWKVDRGMLEDTLDEINSMIEDAGHEGEQDQDEEGFNEEWDELGLGSSKKMSEAELECTKKVQPLVRFATLFHKRVVPDVLAGLSGPQLESSDLISALDALPSRSHAVVVALEEVVATLYAPQNPASVASAVAALTESLRALHASVITNVLVPSDADLAQRMSALSVVQGDGGKAGGETKKDPRKWFDACLAQIDKSAKAVDDVLSPYSANST